METYDTLLQAIEALKNQGYTEDFNLKQNHIECRDGAYCLTHTDFKIDKSFRFDENEDPSDQSVIYAISSEKDHLKGILINGYGIYSEPIANELLEKLR